MNEEKGVIAVNSAEITVISMVDATDEEWQKYLIGMKKQVQRLRELYLSLMIKDHHYGTIPGTQNPSLWKPGAEVLERAAHMHSDISTGCITENRDLIDFSTGKRWDDYPYIEYTSTCTVYDMHGNIVATGGGTCNSWEGKYLWRDAQRKCPDCGMSSIIKGKKFDKKTTEEPGWVCWGKRGGCGTSFPAGDKHIEGQETGRVPSDDYSVANTCLKMAEKRAYVGAIIRALGASVIFTQDRVDEPDDGHLTYRQPDVQYFDPADHPNADKKIVSKARIALAAMENIDQVTDFWDKSEEPLRKSPITREAVLSLVQKRTNDLTPPF